jgi:hypothetical protein
MTAAGPRFRSEVHRSKLAAAIAGARSHAGPCQGGRLELNSYEMRRSPRALPFSCARIRF